MSRREDVSGSVAVMFNAGRKHRKRSGGEIYFGRYGEITGSSALFVI
jgi:hypothetical protein